ncbi:ATP-binding protein [Saccharibacillus alkalitolerans]|uniref:histidine kinase n=1 Tax=Saccharibacillus alkalitolerans TaxID=2705290 RepID=A0ABX0FD41_9BACL|nr:ATP-binding protein [Saccharibacillus alkalitolerans]NGZ77351.1 response regulator [Saccharibacillus alkalitolerans]
MKRAASGSLPRRIAYGTMALFLVLGVLLAAAEFALHRQYADVSNEMDDAIARLNLLQDTERSFQESVSYLRGYAAYGREDLRERTVAAHEDYDRLFANLRGAYDEESGSASAVDGLTELNGNFNTYSTRALELIAAGNDPAVNELARSKGSALVGQMETEFAALVDMQRSRIVEQSERSRELARIVLIVPALILAAALAAALLLIRYLRKAFIQPVMQAEQAVAGIERGEIVTLDGSSRGDEIGRLLGGIGRMADGIRNRQLELENNLLQMEEQREELEAQNDELEAQNEQILQQRSQLEGALGRLTRREAQLEAINAYQRSLVGSTELNDFLHQAIEQLIVVTGCDAAMLVMRSDRLTQTPTTGWSADDLRESGAEESAAAAFRARFGEERYDMLYSSGYPASSAASFGGEPSGPALQAIRINRSVTRRRPVSGAEAGAHGAYETAVDTYYPVYDGDGEERPAGFLMLTTYGGLSAAEGEEELAEGMVRQFIGALFAQLTQAERQRQRRELEQKSRELEQEKQNLRNQRDATQKVIDSIHEALVVCSPDGEILLCNRITAELLDPALRPGTNFIGMMEELRGTLGLPDDAGERLRDALNAEAGDLRARYAFEPPGRPARYFEVYVQRIEDVVWGSVKLFVFRDRTKEEETNRLRDEFVSVVSHELRTPLASILGFSEIMLNRSVKPEKAQKYISTIHGEATRLSGLIGDFLDLQRIEAGKQSYRMLPLDLKPLTEDVAAQWDGRAGHAVRLTLPEGVCAVRSDGDRLKQVLHNLLSNAVKYSPGKDVVDCVLRPEDGRWVVEVRDYGLGIPEDAKPKMFGKFYRVDNSDRRQIGGTGLGLAIVKEMIEDLGGEISFDSVLGEGSTFRFALPALDLPAVDEAVLVLEDDASLGRLITEAFREDGLRTALFPEAEAALLALSRAPADKPPVLCVVDLSLAGELSGWDFIRKLTEEGERSRLPIVISSALDPPAGYAEAEQEKYLRKPFTVKELLELGRRLIERPPARTALALAVPDGSLARASLETHGLDIRQVEANSEFAIAEIGPEDEGGPV